MRQEIPVQEVDAPASDGGNIAAFYNGLAQRNEKAFMSISKALHFIVPSIERFEVERTKQGNLLIEVTDKNLPVSGRVISEGTLRLLGLLALTTRDVPLSVVGYEEPENGVHPRRLRQLAELLNSAAERNDRQFIIITHSALLAELFEPSSLIICTNRNGETKFEPFDEGPLFRHEKGERIAAALDEPNAPQGTPLHERLLRGDFDG
jgi:predicted ATPase